MSALQLDLRSGRRSGNVLTLECEDIPQDIRAGTLLKGLVTRATERYKHLVGKRYQFSVEHLQNGKIGVQFGRG